MNLNLVQIVLDFETKNHIEDNYDFQTKFINYENSSDNYLADCSLSPNDQGKANCKLKKSIYKDYIMEDYIYYNSNSLTIIYLPDKKAIVPLNCNLNLIIKPHPEPGNNKLIIIIIIAIVSVIIIVITTIIICCCIRRKRKYIENNNNNDVFNNTEQKNIYSGITSNTNTNSNQ